MRLRPITPSSLDTATVTDLDSDSVPGVLPVRPWGTGWVRGVGPCQCCSVAMNARPNNATRTPLHVIVAFFIRRSALERRFSRLAVALEPDGGLWIAWPKRSSGVTTDLTEDVVREIAIANGMVDNKVCAIDDTWSGLRLVYRLRDRPSR
jgi:hypothetical protein